MLQNGSVLAAKLAKNSVTNSAIANGVVGTNKLGNGVVTTAKLADGSVTTGKLGSEVAPLLGTLKSGQTLRGVFDLGQSPNLAGDTLTDSYSFQFPLLNNPLGGPANVIDMTVGSPPVTAACSGITGGNGENPAGGSGQSLRLRHREDQHGGHAGRDGQRPRTSWLWAQSHSRRTHNRV